MREFLLYSLAAVGFLMALVLVVLTDGWIIVNWIGVADDDLDPNWLIVGVLNVIGLWFLALGLFAVRSARRRKGQAAPASDAGAS